MFQLPQIPAGVSFALFGFKALEVSALLTKGLARAKTHRDKYDLIAAAYQGELKWLRRLVLFRPRVMIWTGIFLVAVTIWFFLTIYSYYSPNTATARTISGSWFYKYSIGISLGALVFGLLIIVFTSFSFARVYNSFHFILPKYQYQQRLASRVDRDTDGYFYINNEQGEKIARRIVKRVLENPSWYTQSEVYTPSVCAELASAKYANFLFFGELVEAKAGGGRPMERWQWLTEVYKKKPDLFEPTRLKQIMKEGRFANTLVDEMAKYSKTRDPFVGGLYDVLNFGVARLGKHFKYDARNIGQMNAWNRLLLRVRRRSMFQVVDKRLTKFKPYKKRSGNRLVLIKLMVIRKLWNIPVEELEFPFSAWQSVFLLRSKVISTDLEKFSTYDPDFAWFRNAALRALTTQVKDSLDVLSETEKEEMKRIIKSELDSSSAMILTDTFLWKVGYECCSVNSCGEEGTICPFGSLAICRVDEGEKLFSYEAPHFERR